MVTPRRYRRRVGSLTSDWERFFEWKRIADDKEPSRVSLEVMIRGTCDRVRLLDLVENFTLFSEHKAGLVKLIAQNHQFLGVNNAIASMLKARALGHGRGGVRLQAWRDGTDCWFEVEDTGPGMGAAELDGLFEPFSQGDAGRDLTPQQGAHPPRLWHPSNPRHRR